MVNDDKRIICHPVTNLAMTTRAVIVWMKGEPVRLRRGCALARASSRRPKLCSDTLIDIIADMEPQRQANQGFLREDIGLTRPSTVGKEARVH